MAHTASAEAPATALRATWFDGRSSRGRAVLVRLEPGRRGPALHLDVREPGQTGSRRFEHHEVGWPPLWSARQAPPRLTVSLHEHGSVVIDRPDAWQAALRAAGARAGLVQRMQTHWPVLLAVLVVAVLALAGFYRYGTPWAAARLAPHVPLAWELDLSQRALMEIDQRWFKPSKLDAARQQDLREQFNRLLTDLPASIRRYPAYTPRYELLFRRGMGPNALALPGGTLIMTDELVEAAARAGLSDEALLGVLAHEIGHVEHRHATRLVVEQGVLNIGLGLALGDVSSVVSLASTVLTGLAYKRQHESESDCFAVQLMTHQRRPTAPMADLLLRLEQDLGARGAAAKSGDQPRTTVSVPDWLSTHPGTPQRAERLKAGAACGR